jgi:hypothetical protein
MSTGKIKAELDLKEAIRRETALEAELAAVRAEITKIRNYLDLSLRYDSGDAAAVNEAPEDLAASVSPSRPDGAQNVSTLPTAEAAREACRGKSIPDAAIALLALAGRPLTEEDLVERLKQGGVTFVSETPQLTLRFALLKKEKETRVICRRDKGYWAMSSWTVLNQAPPNSGFIQNRDRNDHAERSRQGLLAARARGVKNGRKSTFTPEITERVIRFMREGISDSEICKRIGISRQGFYKWKKRATGEGVKFPR